ncbi:MAG TPA: hypothetical protein VHE55_09985 [Fimbriimonadaceae bacterium]|nr:hypothetical protein [Fimbriimonadaceae bacterium]
MRPLRLYQKRLLLELTRKPAYGYSAYWAARQALALGHQTISLIEFGVAGGNGLVALEWHARYIARRYPIKFEIYGFDSGTGLPEFCGVEDCPHKWQPGFFAMDVGRLRERLRIAELVLGDARETVPKFQESHSPTPIGAILFDLDLYSSTVAALRIFDTPPANFLPRVRCFFDDVLGDEDSLANDYIGERRAICEYNARPGDKRLAPVYHMRAKSWRRAWYSRVFVHHWFTHPDYGRFIGQPDQALPLRSALG